MAAIKINNAFENRDELLKKIVSIKGKKKWDDICIKNIRSGNWFEVFKNLIYRIEYYSAAKVLSYTKQDLIAISTFVKQKPENLDIMAQQLADKAHAEETPKSVAGQLVSGDLEAGINTCYKKIYQQAKAQYPGVEDLTEEYNDGLDYFNSLNPTDTILEFFPENKVEEVLETIEKMFERYPKFSILKNGRVIGLLDELREKFPVGYSDPSSAAGKPGKLNELENAGDPEKMGFKAKEAAYKKLGKKMLALEKKEGLVKKLINTTGKTYLELTVASETGLYPAEVEKYFLPACKALGINPDFYRENMFNAIYEIEFAYEDLVPSGNKKPKKKASDFLIGLNPEEASIVKNAVGVEKADDYVMEYLTDMGVSYNEALENDDFVSKLNSYFYSACNALKLDADEYPNALDVVLDYFNTKYRNK